MPFRQSSASEASVWRPRVRAHAVLSATLIVCSVASQVRAESALAPETGWDAATLETGRSAALSSASRAIGSSISAILQNPANMAANRVYHVGVFGGIWPEADRQSYGAAIVDSSTSSTRLAGGIAGAFTIQDPDGINRRGSDLRLGIAYPFSPVFRVGLLGRYLAFRQNGDGPLGPSLVSGGLEDEVIARGFGFDAGATIQPNKMFSLSLVGTNLNSPGNGFFPTQVGGGVGFGGDLFSVEGDVMADFTTWDRTSTQTMFGGEVLVSDHFPLRAGYKYDTVPRLHWLSAGVGYVDRSMTLEAAVRRTLSGDGATAIVLTFTYHVESSGIGASADGMY
jgi:hypothetical protein